MCEPHDTCLRQRTQRREVGPEGSPTAPPLRLMPTQCHSCPLRAASLARPLPHVPVPNAAQCCLFAKPTWPSGPHKERTQMFSENVVYSPRFCASHSPNHVTLPCSSTAATWPCDSGEALTCLSLECSQVSISIKRFYLSRGHSKMPFGQSSHTLWSSPSLPYPCFKEIFKKQQHTWPNFTILTFSVQTFPPHILSSFPLPLIPSPPCLPLHF